jgi:hypothetical protein
MLKITKLKSISALAVVAVAALGVFIWINMANPAAAQENDAGCQWAWTKGHDVCMHNAAPIVPLIPIVEEAIPITEVAVEPVESTASTMPVQQVGPQPQNVWPRTHSASVNHQIFVPETCTSMQLDFGSMMQAYGQVNLDDGEENWVADGVQHSDALNMRVCYSGNMSASGFVTLTVN